MASKKSKSETYIEFICDHLKNGEVKHKKVFAVFHGKFRLKQRTFDKYWKLAQVRHSEYLVKVKALKETTYLTMEEERSERGILDKLDKMVILTKIAKGKLGKPSISDRIKAIDILNKMDGDYAPVKNEYSGNLTIEGIELPPNGED